MGVDTGDKRIGVALSDPLGKTAQPHRTIARDGTEVEALARVVEEEEVQKVVVGLPLSLDGSEGFQAKKARSFAGELAGKLGVPVVTVDERLSTREAERTMRDGGVRKAGRRGLADMLSAALILRSYMEREKTEGENEGRG